MEKLLSEFVELARKTENEGLIDTRKEVSEWIKSLIVIGASDTKLAKELLEYEANTFYI